MSSTNPVILSLSATERKMFCCGMLYLPFPAEVIGMNYSVFGTLFDITENYATNRNNVILNMIRKIATFPDISIKSTVKKYKKNSQQITLQKS